jgi:hypothetical protein
VDQRSLDTAFSGVRRAASGFCATLYIPIYENNENKKMWNRRVWFSR